MPQFDFVTFIPQIFWLLISFAILYYFASRVILPRIAAILTKREEIVSGDLISAEVIQTQINELEERSKVLKDKSSTSYQHAIEKSLKECIVNREKSLTKIKDDIEKLSIDSEKKISDFVRRSKAEYSKAANLFASTVVKKLLGKDLKVTDKIEVSLNKFDS